jgi:hypothetical protein
LAASESLRVVKHADLHVEKPTKFELVINLKTVPQSVLYQADKVIK